MLLSSLQVGRDTVKGAFALHNLRDIHSLHLDAILF